MPSLTPHRTVSRAFTPASVDAAAAVVAATRPNATKAALQSGGILYAPLCVLLGRFVTRRITPERHAGRYEVNQSGTRPLSGQVKNSVKGEFS
jgi:hypothetical protein